MEKVIEKQVYYSIDIGGRSIPFITDTVVNMWIIMAVIMVATLLLTRKLTRIPSGGQKIAETLVDFVGNMAKTQIGHHYKPFVPYLGTVLIFLAASNLIAIFNIIPDGHDLAIFFNNPALENFEFGLHPPTKDFNVTLCLALFSIIIVVGSEFKYRGFKGWVRSFYTPTPISAFIKLLDYVVRPMSLCLRLFGNILGGFIVMTLLYMAMPVFAPAVIGIYFDIFDGCLQAYVFVFLTMLYIAEAVEEE